jgi:ApeA N-terminal domain 1
MDDGPLSFGESWRGRFWLPGQPEDEQRGIVTYDPKRGVTLSLVGGFGSQRPSLDVPTERLAARDMSGRFPIIHGRLGSQPVSLLDCLVTESTSSGFGFEPDEQEVRVGRMLTGVFLDDPEAEVFSELTVELENLTRWDRRGDIVSHVEHDPTHPRGEKWKLSVDPVAPLTVTVDDLTIELGRRYVTPSADMRREGLEASAFVASYLTIATSQPKSISQWLETEKQFQDLLTFAMDAPCAVLSEAFTPTEDLRNDEQSEARNEVWLYARHINVGDPRAPSVEGRDALFTLANAGVDFHTLIPRWVSVNNRFRTTCDLILGLRYVKGGYLSNQLITAVAAAEAMHAAMTFDPPMPNAEFKALKKTLLQAVPKHQRQWLREKLGSNKHTLVRQLTDLAGLPDQELMGSLLRNVDAWARATKNERNPVAHGGNMSADVQLLRAITMATTAVVLVNLLHQLGIPKERLIFAMVDNPTLSIAARLAREQWPAVSA